MVNLIPEIGQSYRINRIVYFNLISLQIWFYRLPETDIYTSWFNYEIAICGQWNYFTFVSSLF